MGTILRSTSSTIDDERNDTPQLQKAEGAADAVAADALSSLSRDLSLLAALRPPIPSADLSVPTAIVSAGSSYTRLWTQVTWWRHADPPHVRYFRHVRSWPLSTSARKILPAVVLTALYSLIMAFATQHLSVGRYHLQSMAKGSSAAMAALSAPLALLLTLRANASLGRLNEARVLFGRMILWGRNLASVLKTYVFPTNPKTAILATRYLSVLGWSIKALVRNESADSQREVYEIMLGRKEAEWILSQKIRPPLAILLRIRQIVADVAMKCTNPNFFVPHSALESAIDDLDAVIGGCERLLTSPIPSTYSRHLSRIMVMYLAILPFALVATGTPSLGAAVASALVSYVIVGVDEIGMEIENPFPLLPLQQLCGAFQSVVAEHMLLSTGDSPSLIGGNTTK